MIYSTATPSDDLIQLVNQKKCIHVQLNSRYTRRAMIRSIKYYWIYMDVMDTNDP